MRGFLLIFFLYSGLELLAQERSLPQRPIGEVVGSLSEPITNAAVAYYSKSGQDYLYVFGGLDSTLDKSGIHRKCFRYDLATGQTKRLPDLPDSRGKLAASATRIGDKIYVIGGYYVNPNNSETTSRKVHVFDPKTDSFQADAAFLPVPTDDHIQFSYRDSLIYCISGWSDGKNIRNVQVLDPATNKWFQANPIPDSLNYASFGGTGGLLESTSTFYLIGGASDSTGFPGLKKRVRGRILGNDALTIDWSANYHVKTDRVLYRSLMTPDGSVIGGSENTYNYDAIAYDGSGIVRPRSAYTGAFGGNLELKWHFWIDRDTSAVPMDIRDWGTKPRTNPQKEWYDTLYSVGGILDSQRVTAQVIRYFVLPPSSVTEEKEVETLKIFPNPSKGSIQLNSTRENRLEIEIYDLLGNRLLSKEVESGARIDISTYPEGMYLLYLAERGETYKIFKQ